MLMTAVGHAISGLGVLLFLVGAGYWILFFLHDNRRRVMLRKSPWGLLGNLTILGPLVFAVGQALVGMAQRPVLETPGRSTEPAASLSQAPHDLRQR